MPPRAELTGLSKNYDGVAALKGVSLTVEAGEVHALVGENGAGKSTLIKILAGSVVPDEGEVHVDGAVMPVGDVRASERAGVAVVHQESTAFLDLSVEDNLFLGQEPRIGWLTDRRKMRTQARELLAGLGEDLPLGVPLANFSPAQRQMVAIARAVSADCQVLVLDEPTASLSHRESETLHAVVRRLRSQGVGILFVSHRLEEVLDLADRVTVLRDGQWVETQPVSHVTKGSLINAMVGRDLATPTMTEDRALPGEPALDLMSLSSTSGFQDVSFSVHSGEIVGLGGLVGAGRSELTRAIFGVDGYSSGKVRVHGRDLARQDVEAAMKAGIALVPEDRQHEGLVLAMSVRENTVLAVRRSLSRFGMIQRRPEQDVAKRESTAMSVKAASLELPVGSLSGGNQQKVVLGKWMATKPQILILDEPTRGIDVGAKAEIHELIQRLAASGTAVLLVSSDMPELLALSHRIIVLREGRVSGELSRSEATEARILSLALPDAGGVLGP